MQALKERFWQEWSTHFLYGRSNLRPKWRKAIRNAEVGDSVLIREKNLPRLKWSTGTIEKVIPSEDGLVRRVVVKPIKRSDKNTTERERERAVHDLILLEESLLDQDDEDLSNPGGPTGIPESELKNAPVICKVCVNLRDESIRQCSRLRHRIKKASCSWEKSSKEQGVICYCKNCLEDYQYPTAPGSGVTIL